MQREENELFDQLLLRAQTWYNELRMQLLELFRRAYKFATDMQPPERNEVLERIDEGRRSLEDPTCYVVIIGEGRVGKSLLVNLLLREDLTLIYTLKTIVEVRYLMTALGEENEDGCECHEVASPAEHYLPLAEFGDEFEGELPDKHLPLKLGLDHPALQVCSIAHTFLAD